MVWVTAHSNLALVKYWGKADERANHPAGPSLSVTLDGLTSAVGLCFQRELAQNQVSGLPPGPARRVSDFLDGVGKRLGIDRRASVTIASNFPVAAGLASSASTFAALATAAVAAAGVEASADEVADIARLGSGSACRSIHGGFVEWRPEGTGSRVVPVAPAEHWPLAILVAITSESAKRVSSREGMKRTAATSPYYLPWLESGPGDLAEVRAAILERDLARLGPVVERNCLRMHAAAFAADPPLVYWEPATIAVIRRIWKMREEGVEAYFSIDAGPPVKVLCAGDAADRVASALERVPGVLRVLRSRPGGAPVVWERAPEWVRAEGAAAEVA
jgi:diphosphomevalonate decarboxylase